MLPFGYVIVSKAIALRCAEQELRNYEGTIIRTSSIGNRNRNKKNERSKSRSREVIVAHENGQERLLRIHCNG